MYAPKRNSAAITKLGRNVVWSPDITPIQPVCDVLGWKLQPSRISCNLTTQLQRLWHDLLQEITGNLIDSMLHRVSACIASTRSGITTHYL
ncbi:hypothetical protein TNCV_1662941 [Trichonephila clavipes]|nr:hypothetical protein TNCV_1662941 [Trichonephila clavipes]